MSYNYRYNRQGMFSALGIFFVFLIGIGVFLMPVNSSDASTKKKPVESKKTIELACKLEETFATKIYLTVNYKTNTVVTSKRDMTTPETDYEGQSVQPAHISESEIIWQIVMDKSESRAHTVYYTLNRLTGILRVLDNGTQGRGNCEIAEKPLPKF
jgi:hypothetical protein